MWRRSSTWSSATAAVAVICATAPGPTSAAEVRPGGKLDITVSGFARFYWGQGDLSERFNVPSAGSSDFRNDTEVHFRASSTDESTGIDYGATIELEADTNKTANADETFVWLRGAFGRVLLGDDDGTAKDYSYMAQSVAVATGGLDGEIVKSADLVFLVASDSDNTKIKYDSPSIGGFQLGASYMPHLGSGGDDFPGSTADGSIDDVVGAALRYTGTLGGIDIAASLAGELGHLNSAADDDYRGMVASAKLGIAGFKFAGGWATQERGNVDRDFYSIGAAYDFGLVAVSVNWGDCYNCTDRENTNLVFGAAMGLVPGVSLGAEISFFDEARGGDDDGYVTNVSIRLAF